MTTETAKQSIFDIARGLRARHPGHMLVGSHAQPRMLPCYLSCPTYLSYDTAVLQSECFSTTGFRTYIAATLLRTQPCLITARSDPPGKYSTLTLQGAFPSYHKEGPSGSSHARACSTRQIKVLGGGASHGIRHRPRQASHDTTAVATSLRQYTRHESFVRWPTYELLLMGASSRQPGWLNLVSPGQNKRYCKQ